MDTYVDVITQSLKYSLSGLMNLATQTPADDAKKNVFFVNFNQDCS